ncbi:MAG: bifunctional serine/threonine-protein kinase/formylglycine-generating enzyme family protein, partial [Planctomycetota bacterium]|nr:bifunctional serine/threonine-protein kinase/formylglycine-generating enzyme family protein [Planctomycetota bacterium]
TQLMSKKVKDRPENGREILETLQKCSRELGPSKEEEATLTTDPVLGDRVGEWRLVELLGVGGMGRVYLGELGLKKAAVKVLQSKSSSKNTALKRFEREIDILRKLTHPNIIGIIDSGVVEKNSLSYPYVVLEHCNLDLAHRVDQSGPLSPKEVIDVGIAVAQALSVAHVRGIIHRDVKPQNILLKGEVINVSSVRLTDFGVARLHNSDQDLTRTRSAIGSPYYMAPEQAKEGDIDARADLYSLGATLYYLLTASYLYKGADVERLIYAHAHELHEPAIVRNPNVPKGLSLIIDYLLLKSANERVPDCKTLIGDLQALAVGGLPKNRTQELQALVNAGRRPYEVRSNKLALVLTILLTLLLGGFITLIVNRPEPFRSIRTTEANLKQDLAALPIDNAAKMQELLSEYRALRKSTKGIVEAGNEMPPDIEKKFEVFELQIGNRILLRAERLFSISLENPLGKEKAAKLSSIETMLKSIQSLTLSSSDSLRLKKVESELLCFREAFPFLDSVAQILGQYGKGAYQSCLPQFEKLRKSYDEFEAKNSQSTRVLLALNDVIESLELSQSSCTKKIQELEAQLALYERRCQSAIKMKSHSQLSAVQALVSKEFLEGLPAGNEALEQSARKLLLIRLSLELDKAKQRLGALIQWQAKNPGQFSYLLTQLKGLDSDYPAKLYPKISAQISELRVETTQARNQAAESLFKVLVKSQQLRLEGFSLKIEDFKEFQDQVESFPKNSQLLGWKDRERACQEQIELINQSKKNYAKLLTKLARIRFLERKKTTGSTAFLQQLNEVKQLLQRAAKFPNYDTKMGLWIQTQCRFLASLHHESVMQPFAKSELTVGRDDEGFPHNPAHKVKLAAFAIDRYETSVEEFGQFLSFLRELSDARPQWCGVDESLATPLEWSKQLKQPTHPVRGVTHDVAMIYCRYAGKQLPTEYQWECAIRFAGKNAGPYGWGKTWPDSRLARFKSSGPVAARKAYSKTLGGLLHMNGNVAEWTLSRLKPYPGANKDVDLRGLNPSFYVVRGGSFGSEDIELNLWRRDSQDPRVKNLKTGFRCLVSVGN